MYKISMLLLGGLLMVGQVKAQTKLIEKVTKKGDELIIPYEKYRLANGLTLIIHEDHSDPIVHVDVTYHVGSAREEIGKSGFAHFFEHMMFQGSDNVADEEHFRVVTEAGGTLNGTTNRDRTNYFETLPSNQLEVALWLEADRMGFLLDAVTQKKFEVQRETVKNERGQNYDNRPYGLASENIGKNLYPYGHPYSWLTIGYLEDLDRVDVNDLKNFFLRWYGPNNAVLTIGGDVNPKEVVKLVEKYFGSIPRGPEVKNMPAMPGKLDKDRYVSYEDNYIRVPQLYMVWPSVPLYHADEAPLAALAEIIGQGRNSIFFKNFQKDQKALFAQAFNSTSELAGEFTVSVRPFPGKGLAEMEQLVRESLKEFESTGVDDDALERFIASYESRTLNSLQSIGSFGGKVSKLAAYETFAGNPNYIKKDLERYMSITKDDIRRVYNTYIKDKPAVILSVIPKGGEALKAATDNYTIDESQYKPGKDEYAGLTYKKPKDKFDRSKKPGAGPNPVVKVPDYWREDFKNGIQVIGTKYDELPLVQVLITIRGGHMMSATDPGKAGVASIMGSLMNEGTQKYSAEEFNNELRKLGSSISVNAGSESISVSMQSTLKNLDKTIALLEERMMHPKFEEADLERVKKQQLEGIKNAMTQPASIASRIFSDLLWGKESFRAMSTSGTEETVNAISLADVEEFYKKYFTPSVAEMVIVGNMEKADVLSRLAFLQSWKGATVEVPQYGKGNVPDKTRIYLVNVDKAAQSEIRIGYPTGMTYDATGESYRVGLMNFALGGAFNSRINLNLREDKGWTYGARSSFIAGKNPGFFQASAGVKASATDSAVFEFINELKTYAAEGITPKELAFMKSSLGQSDARNYETLFQKAGFLNTILSYNLERDYKKKQEAILKAMKEEDVDKLAKKMLKTDNMYIVVVGDAALVRPGLERLGYEIIELDKEGNISK